MTTPEVGQRDESTALARQQPIASTSMLAFDPFQMMDRFDEEALNKELQGRVADELVYVIKDRGQEVVGLSKAGVDECCMALVEQGQVIREDEIEYSERGEGESTEALFKCKASRYAVSADGKVEVRLDSVIGVKRQPLYYEASTLDLDAKVPSKKFRGKTYRELLAIDEGRDYLGWMAENFKEEAIRVFVKRLLDGEDVTALTGRQLNPHWYEHGCMKAARNARFRLIPGKVRQSIIVQARKAGQVREAEMPTQQQQAAAPVETALMRAANRPLPGSLKKWGGYAQQPLSAVPSTMLNRVTDWAVDNRLAAEEKNDHDALRRFDELSRDIALVLDARTRGDLPEPPHKDGTTDPQPGTQREPGED